MAKLKYSFTLPKKAVMRVPDPNDPQKSRVIEIGHVATYTDINGKVSVTIMFHKKFPMNIMKLIAEDPTRISIVGQPKDITDIELSDLIETKE